jgi:hypothetical protein
MSGEMNSWNALTRKDMELKLFELNTDAVVGVYTSWACRVQYCSVSLSTDCHDSLAHGEARVPPDGGVLRNSDTVNTYQTRVYTPNEALPTFQLRLTREASLKQRSRRLPVRRQLQVS